jgi:hypothetical protein
MRGFTITAAKFGAMLLLCVIGCTTLWGLFVTDRLYNCTDPGWLDFLFPGHWVHHPVAVAHVVAGRSMSEPDTIRAGWSITGLWCLWFSFIVVSLVVSFLLARRSWFPSLVSEPTETTDS